MFWYTLIGRVYSVWGSTNLTAAWSNVLELLGDGNRKTYTNPPSGDNYFLRLKVRMQE